MRMHAAGKMFLLATSLSAMRVSQNSIKQFPGLLSNVHCSYRDTQQWGRKNPTFTTMRGDSLCSSSNDARRYWHLRSWYRKRLNDWSGPPRRACPNGPPNSASKKKRRRCHCPTAGSEGKLRRLVLCIIGSLWQPPVV